MTKTKPTFDHTTTVLADAYNEGALKHMTCQACAVGTIVAACNKPYHWGDIRTLRSDRHGWGDPSLARPTILTGLTDIVHTEIQKLIKRSGWKEIDDTGYTYAELGRIECAFEGDFRVSNQNKKATCEAIHRVVDCLADIHGATPQEVEEAKKKFK